MSQSEVYHLNLNKMSELNLALIKQMKAFSKRVKLLRNARALLTEGCDSCAIVLICGEDNRIDVVAKLNSMVNQSKELEDLLCKATMQICCNLEGFPGKSVIQPVNFVSTGDIKNKAIYFPCITASQFYYKLSLEDGVFSKIEAPLP